MFGSQCSYFKQNINGQFDSFLSDQFYFYFTEVEEGMGFRIIIVIIIFCILAAVIVAAFIVWIVKKRLEL